ncbi:MAG: hypothetical protein ISS71_08140, partial [Phycisphaerae bacterium]|nr:hypothetical protein [Phycisphaerae bacterium]
MKTLYQCLIICLKCLTKRRPLCVIPHRYLLSVIPAKAGIQGFFYSVLISLVCISVPVFAAGEFAIDLSGDSQELPDIDGSMVVWQEYLSAYEDYDIFGIDLDTGSGYIYIIGWIYDQTNPRVSGTRVTWQDDYYGDGTDWDIYLSDISNPSGILRYPVAITEDIAETNPAIHGNTLVWQTNYGTQAAPDWNILAADMTEPNVPRIYEADAYDTNQTNARLYRNTVVYQDDTSANQDIWSADIWMKNNPVYASVFVDELAALDQTNPAVWGDTVVFQADSGSGDEDIYAADISDPANPVVFTIADSAADQTNPDISRHIVVWQDFRNGDWDIYG